MWVRRDLSFSPYQSPDWISNSVIGILTTLLFVGINDDLILNWSGKEIWLFEIGVRSGTQDDMLIISRVEFDSCIVLVARLRFIDVSIFIIVHIGLSKVNGFRLSS